MRLVVVLTMLVATPAWAQSAREKHALDRIAAAMSVVGKCSRYEMNLVEAARLLTSRGVKVADIEPGGRHFDYIVRTGKRTDQIVADGSEAAACSMAESLYGSSGRDARGLLMRK